MTSAKKSSEKLTRYVAFLRGINVGGNNLIKMATLRSAFESYVFADVKTLIASGNILFSAPAKPVNQLTKFLEENLEKTFGFSMGVLLRTTNQIAALAKSDPFKSVRHPPSAKLYVSFLSEKPKATLKLPYESPEKDFKIVKVSDSEVFSIALPLPNGRFGNSMAMIEKTFGKKVTTRNWNTVLKIAAL